MLRRYAATLVTWRRTRPWSTTETAFDAALAAARAEGAACCERVAARIRGFAKAQRGALSTCGQPMPGGTRRPRGVPLSAAGCYAPGGRYPLPSSVLMTAVTARAAGVDTVVVASPRPEPVILAAAAVAGADVLLAAGGAQAIAALAYGHRDGARPAT